MELKIINADGTKGVLPLDEGVKIDFEAMGVHSAEEVTAIKMKAEGDIKQAMEAKLTEAQQKTDTLQAQLEAAKNSSGNKNQDFIELKQQLIDMQSTTKALTDQINTERQETKTQTYLSSLKTKAGSMKLVEGAMDTYVMQAQSAKIENGDGTVQYTLPSGGVGSIDQYTDEWAKSSVGKALTVSSQIGGAGTLSTGLPTINGVMSADDKAAYIADNGLPAFQKLVASGGLKKKE